MNFAVRLAILGDETVESAVVTEWLVQEGETIEKGDELVEMFTDKAAFSVDSPRAGVVHKICVDDGDEVNVKDIICVIDTD